MFDKFFDRLFNGSNEKEVKKIRKIVEQQINPLEDGLKKLSDSSLANKTNEFKARLAKGETLDDILPEAFAVVREASRRVRTGHAPFRCAADWRYCSPPR